MDAQQTTPDVQVSVGFLVTSHLAMAAVALWWAAHPDQWFLVNESDSVEPTVVLGTGVGVGVAILLASEGLQRVSAQARRLQQDLIHLFGPLHGWQLVLLVFTGVISEEMLFRGAMMESWGIVASSLIFGAVHGGLWGRWAIWSLWATAAGFAFSGAVWATGSLWSSIIAHGIVNGWTLARYKRGAMT